MSSIRLLVLSVATVCILAGYRSYGRERPIPPRGDAMVEKLLARDADLLAGQVFEAAATRAEWQAFRPRLKAELFQVLGLWPVPERTPLHARVTGTLDREGPVVIEKIHFQSRPGLFVTGISGGGAATFWIAAADDRVACAAPASGMSDLESYVNHKIISRRSPCLAPRRTDLPQRTARARCACRPRVAGAPAADADRGQGRRLVADQSPL